MHLIARTTTPSIALSSLKTGIQATTKD